LVWWKGGGFLGKAKIPLFMYAIQLMTNWIWTPIFFGFQSLLGALIVIIFLWVFVVFTTFLFYRVYAPAGFIMLPYVAWITFATILNASLWSLNK
jgi:translocator protein